MSALWLLACGAALEVQGVVRPGGVEVDLSAPVEEITVFDAAGVSIARRAVSSELREVWVDVPRQWVTARAVEVRAGQVRARVALRPPVVWAGVALEVQLPPGNWAEWDGTTPLTLSPVGGDPAPLGVLLRALKPGVLILEGSGFSEEIAFSRYGEERLWRGALREGDSLTLGWGEERWALPLAWAPVSLAQAQRDIRVKSAVFPADARGLPEGGRPKRRVTLPWVALGWGRRVAADQAPWAYEGITLENQGDRPLDVALAAEVHGPGGERSAAFRPRTRESDGRVQGVVALLRVPARGVATAALPVWVDPQLAGAGSYTRVLRVTPVQGGAALLEDRAPLYVSRGSPWIAAGLALTAAGALLGGITLRRGFPRWLRALPTSALLTVALFAALVSALSAASRLLGGGLAALFGPFSPLITGIADDVLRTALLATLLALLPYPGVAALAVLLGYLIQLTLLGQFSPLDLVFLLARVGWLEGALALSGHRRGGGRWRLGLALGVASLLATTSGLVLHTTLYRLWFAPWYVAMILMFPGFIYPLVGVWLSGGLAASLKRVEP